MSYDVAVYVVGWLLVWPTRWQKIADLSEPVFVLSTNDAYAHGHTDEPTMAIGDNATRCASHENEIHAGSYENTGISYENTGI